MIRHDRLCEKGLQVENEYLWMFIRDGKTRGTRARGI